ncbi:proline--tRNA ligase [Sulfurovum mangrovi]|uniref:proline--tRNA ligase n=1 Tax=Sulfurovum mangrovi TaxID=2893889 RepID=UPI001E5ED4CC|nr:proline--tRNA ligase [Sulfurovum mangrovi]UFH59961.1 proline--tRNA ligase [Sulfurovum mangrovi]
MRFTQLLIPTTKETPNDATLASHIYLIRGGFIQSVGGSGLYNFLPLGKKVLDKVQRVVKEELDRAGCQEVSLSMVTPASLWQESGRFEKYGKELLRFKDRKDNDFVLGPTHEEMMVNLVRQTVKSYKQLPLNLYQVNLKFRDEIRPRFGLMRGREFLMKDGYSFHSSEEDMKREFALMEETYKKIFTRLGLEFRVVEADSGAIGGSGSKEFMVLADSGEDTIVVCDSCEYGANIEAAVRQPKKCDAEAPEATFARFHTPEVKTIEALSAFFKVDPYYLVKTVAKRALYDEGESKIVLFALRGSDELQEVKACNAVNANDLVDVSEEELAEAGLIAGFMGPTTAPEGITVVYDNELKDASSMICGANEKDYHLVGNNFVGIEADFDDLVAVQEGDICTCCGGTLRYTKGIEAGHIFQLGTVYSEPLGCEFLDENGKAVPMVMGTYGIGVSRLLAAIIEQNHDDKGCIWTKESAPFDLHILVSNIKDEAQLALAEKLYAAMKAKGVDVILDDRKDRFGAKMKDYELLGIPHSVVIGKKLAEGKVEFVTRKEMLKEEVSAEEILSLLEERF